MLNGNGKLSSVSTTNVCRRDGDVLACVASVSNRVIARKLERGAKKEKVEGAGGGEGRRGNACPQTPQFWKTPLDISRFGSFVN